MQSPRAHRHSGLAVVPRLKRVAMKHEPVNSFAKSPIAQRLDSRGMMEPALLVIRGESLRAQDALPINVGCRSHLHATIRGVVTPRPEFGHRLIRLARVG